MSFQRVWSDEEEEIVCRGYLNHRNDCRNHVDEIVQELHDKGYTSKTREKVLAKLGDFKRVAENRDLSHVANATIKAYKKLYASKLAFLHEIKNYMREMYGREGITDYDVPVDVVDNGGNILINVNFDLSAPKTNAFAVREINRKLGPTFVDLLINLLNQDGRDNADIYNSVSMDRRVFSKLMQGQSVSKRNILKIAIALQLDLETTRELLASAGFALDTSKKMDVVVMFAIEHKIYDPFEIEEALDEWGEPSLFYID